MRDPQAWGKALLRITLGIIFVLHGYRHYAHGARAAARTIAQMGFPSEFSATLAWYLIIVHIVGGALMIMGFWTRLAAFLQLPIMLAAVMLLHARQGVDELEFPLLVLVGALTVVLLGPGTLAIDKAAGGGGGRRRGA
jgi:putative oxidoreductase